MFSPFFLSLVKHLIMLVMLSKNQFLFHWFSLLAFSFQFTDLYSDFSFLSLTLDLICSCFSNSLGLKLRYWVWNLLFSNKYIQCYNFPVNHCFWYIPQILKDCGVFFSFSSKYIYLESSSLTYVLFRSILFNLHVFEGFPVIFLLSISSLIPLWS